MKKDIVHFTHNDLDAIGCMLNLHIATPNFTKITYHTNYKDIVQKSNDIMTYITQNNISTLVITDISFSENKEILEEFWKVCQRYNINMIHIDHHIYPDNFFDDIKWIYRHDISKSATILTQEFFKTKGINKSLDNLSDIINVFDIWLQTDKLFPSSLKLDWGFHIYIENKSLDILCAEIIDNNYKLPSQYIKILEPYNETVVSKIQNYRKRNLITNDGFVTLAFVDDIYNNILYEEFSKKIPIIVIINSYGIIRFRFNSVYELPLKTRQTIRSIILKDKIIGHINAFSIKVENSNFNKIMDKIKDIITILVPFRDEYLKEQKTNF